MNRIGIVVALCFLYASVGWRYRELVEPEYVADGLLWGLWVVMTGAIAWRFRLVEDGSLMLVAAAGGFVIEWWGTNTNLWHYFTRERPPLWIVPAWPVATIVIDRMAGVSSRWLSRLAFGYWAILPAFVIVMTSFAWPTVDVFATRVVIALMIGVVVMRATPERDVTLFVCGSLLGIVLEYWGTSRQCWTYYSGEVPPPEAVFAHGFASVAFGRAHRLLDPLWAPLRSLAAVQPGRMFVSARRP
jgi:hypothetical protein